MASIYSISRPNSLNPNEIPWISPYVTILLFKSPRNLMEKSWKPASWPDPRGEMPGDGVDLALHLHLHTTSVVRLDLGILGTMLNLHQAFEIMIRRYRLLPLHFKYYRFLFFGHGSRSWNHGIGSLEDNSEWTSWNMTWHGGRSQK